MNSLELLDYKTRGSLPGEGVAFFMLGGQKGHADLAILRSVTTFYKPGSHAEVEQIIEHFLAKEGLTAGDIDLVIAGVNGDIHSDRIYFRLSEGKLSNLPFAYYKHLCGEYDTSSSFALWLASVILKNQHVPNCIRLGGTNLGEINKILIYNHLRGNNHVLYVTERC